jgi:hypothetical protein
MSNSDVRNKLKTLTAVYVAIAAFENAARQFVTTVLREAVGDEWWDNAVSSGIRAKCKSREEDEAKHRFHTQRGSVPINYTDLGQLGNIIRQNPQHFVPDFLPTVEWAAAIFDAVERSRNVIMHSGILDAEDLARLGINIRDWVKQVGV